VESADCICTNAPTPTPTPPGPIPAGCPTAAGRPVAILDVTLQAATDTVPAGATLCLTAATGSQTITVLGAGETTTATVNVVLQLLQPLRLVLLVL
jgi:hypothetical protein